MYPNQVGYQALGQARRPLPPTTKTIPFDYVFQFPLKGERDNRVQDVVEISMEGVFVALSLGYSVVLDEQKRPRTFQPVNDQRTTPQNPVLVPVFPQPAPDLFNTILVAGLPGAAIAVLLLASPSGPVIEALPSPPPPPPDPPSVLAVDTIGPDGTVLVSLGFAIPSGSILRVWDRTNNLLSQLFEVGSIPDNGNGFATTPGIGPNPTDRKLPAAGDNRVHVYGSPGVNVELFLLTSTITTGTAVPRNGPLVALHPETGTREVELLPTGTKLSAGDVLLVSGTQVTNVPFSMFTVPRPRLSTISLGALAAGLEKIGADLTGGFRLNPNFAALATADPPLDQQTAGTLDRAFETGAVAAEEASFRYSIDVVSTGRELQNKEIHNIAGLGIANGDRPFRPFAKPMMFEPRSSIRIQITEISGPPGTLFIVLQGYKMLGTGRIPG
jgi:hypothetical protein